MAAAAQPAFLSLEEYLHTSYRPDCDYVDGEVQKRGGGEFEHSLIQGAFAAWFFVREHEWNIYSLIAQRVRVAGRRVRIPDVCLVRRDMPREKVLVTAPLLCIEILSPEDRMQRTLERLEDYRQMGVAAIWLVDPIQRLAYTYDADGLHSCTEQKLAIDGTPIFADLADIFSALD
jgi:Uma2 family endonuclease